MGSFRNGILFQKDSPYHRSTSCVQICVKFGRPEIGKVVRYLHDKKKFASLSRSRFGAGRAQNRPDQRQTIYSQCPKFRPNWFTSGGVIAERVNTVETHRKVFPIFGRSAASTSSRITRKAQAHFVLSLIHI